MKVKFTKDWRQYQVDDIAELNDETAKTLIKFDYAKDTSGAIRQDANDSAETEDSKQPDQ